MVESLRFILRVWDRTGQLVVPDEFFKQLSFQAGDAASMMDGPGAPSVQLLFASIEDFPDGPERYEAFEAVLQQGLVRAAEWLGRQAASVFEEFRATGRVTDVFIGGWMTDDQFDLHLPPEFLQACGALGLTLSICTND